MKVLHVDADEDSSDHVESALGCSVEAVAAADAARARLRESPVDCLVTELALPGTDGVAFVEEVHAAHPDVPVVVYTAAGSERLAGEAVAAGAEAYVPKSDVETLATRVADLVEGQAAPRAPELLVEQSPLAIVEWGHEFRARSWNPAAERLFGYDAADAVGEHLWDLIVPGSARDEVEDIVNELLDGGGGRFNVNENVRADGSTVTCEWHNVPRYDADGEVAGVLSFARNVTDRERRSRILESLQETTGEMIRMDTPEDIAAAAVTAVREVLGHPLSAIRLFDADREVLELAALTEPGREMVAATEHGADPVGPGDDVIWTAFASGEARVVDRLAPGDTVYESASPVESLVVQPLGDHGVLTLGASEPAAFRETEVQLVDILAKTVEAAMDRADRQRDLERFETIVEAAGDGVFTLDEDGRLAQVNDRFVDLVGQDRETLLGADPLVFLEEADLETGRRHVRRLLEGEADVVNYEVTIRRPDGEELPCEVSQSLLPGDVFQGTVGTARDVRERERMEAELRERKQKIEALHAVASDLETCESRAGAASIAVDAAAKVLDFDECVMRERTDEGFTLLAATSDAAPAHSAGNGLYAETLAAGDSVVVADLDERDLDVESPQGVRSALSVPVGDDAVLQALATEPGAFDADDVELAELLASHVADALERLAVRSELRAERDRFAALFDNVPDPVVAATHDDSVPLVTAVNPAFEETFGFDADEVIGENLDDLIVPPESEAVAVDANREAHEGTVVEAEVRRTTADGLRDFRLTVVPVELGVDSPATFGVYTDVTERKQRRKRVEVLNRVLRHDLRNGMNIVRGEAELLAADLDASGADHARTILDRADELQRLAERTRAVERSLDRDTSTAGPIDLARVVEETASDLRDRFPEAELTVETPDTAVVVGENLLELAVFDAMENALVHNDRSNPAVSVTVDRNGDDVVVSVADDGPGIPEAERRLLAGDEEITQLHHGSGLGLWLVHWAVTHSGGELSFDDNDPRGSVVTMRVPARTEAHPAQPAEE